MIRVPTIRVGRAAVESRWARFALRRLARLLVVLGVVVLVTFAMVHLVPGDPVRRILGAHAPAAVVAQVRHQLGLDQPLSQQFWHYITGLLHGDLGTSFVTHEAVTTVIAERIGSTMQLAGLAIAIVLIFGIIGGVVAGTLSRGGSRLFEAAWSGTTGVFGSLPHYLTGTFLAFIFAVVLRWFPVAGAGPWAAAVLPSLAIAIRPTAMVARLARVETLNVLEQQYVQTARSKRLPAWKLNVFHVFPNVLTASLTLAGLVFASLVSGAVVVEQVFARPGLGTSLVQAVLEGDYAVIEGITLLLATFVVVANALIDSVLAVLDPRTLVAAQ